MEVTTNGGDDFKKLGQRFRAAGKDGATIRKTLTATIQKHLRRITDEQKAAARAMTVKGTAGAGSARRQAFHEAGRLRGRNVRARKGGYGLRASVAQAIKSKVSYTGRKLGARITVDASALPPSQRKLPRHLDNPRGWRHPVFGNRQVWVRQVGESYFSGPIERHRRSVQRDIKSEIDNMLKRLQ